MTLDWLTFAAIAGMAAATYLTRVLGFWMVARLSLKGRGAAALEAVPGSVLIAVIAPTVLLQGPAEVLAAVITLGLAWRMPILVAVIGGVASVVALRWLLG
ncbi:MULTISPECIES: AzlD family protein [Limibacillus]|jgi:uncharacterized membrane protein|uniref:Putative membrane protein n=1 Tax=Limibacillus halophilus TaxID=1579333 RepID=A0A839SXV6_9PROT|nr:AzlD domain-containing protein [Limibacillus halophilus]MBB3066366.1 putative membrane protein [Limibacillus halophilus]